jgi:hypothetical protein
MATERRNAHVPEGIDPDASPFEAPPVEGLPLTKEERAELKRALAEFDRRRAAADER